MRGHTHTHTPQAVLIATVMEYFRHRVARCASGVPGVPLQSHCLAGVDTLGSGESMCRNTVEPSDLHHSHSGALLRADNTPSSSQPPLAFLPLFTHASPTGPSRSLAGTS